MATRGDGHAVRMATRGDGHAVRMASRGDGHAVCRKRLGRLPVNTQSTAGREWKSVSNNADGRSIYRATKKDGKHQFQQEKTVPMASKSSFSLSLCSEFDTEMVDIVEQMEKEQQGSGVPSCKRKVTPDRSVPKTDAKSQQNVGKEGQVFPQTSLEKRNTTGEHRKITPKPNTALNKRSAPSGKANKKMSAVNDHNISWQSPQEASTPNLTHTQGVSKRPRVSDRTTPHVQTQLFKSLFTIPSPMCGLETSLNLGVDSQKENSVDNIRNGKSNFCETPRRSLRGKRTESLCTGSEAPGDNQGLHQKMPKKNSTEGTAGKGDRSRRNIQSSHVPDTGTRDQWSCENSIKSLDRPMLVEDSQSPETKQGCAPEIQTAISKQADIGPVTSDVISNKKTSNQGPVSCDVISNQGSVSCDVISNNKISNQGSVSCDVISNNKISNQGSVSCDVISNNKISNQGSVSCDVISNNKISNQGSVSCDVISNNKISNQGSVSCDVISNNKISNQGSVSCDVISNNKISNQGSVSCDVISNQGSVPCDVISNNKISNQGLVSCDVISNNKTSKAGPKASDVKSNEKTNNLGPESSDVDTNKKTSNTPDLTGIALKTKTKSGTEMSTEGTDRLVLANWGLPDTVLNQYHKRGITTMFDWQAECLCTENVLAGGNLVYSAPTSAGKTMVAELLVLKRIVETKKKAIIILPFVSVTREKMFYLQELYQDAGIRVNGFMGSHSPPGGLSSVDVAVCTIEKGNGLVNRMLEENSLDQLGIIVVDELHLVGDPHRGYLLELLLTKICYVIRKEQARATVNQKGVSEVIHNPIQIVGMSATLPNLDLLASWLNAKMFITDFRPVPLTETIKLGTAIYDSSMSKMRDVDLTRTFKGDDDHVIPLCLETLTNGHSVLIFCPSKNWCEKLCESIAREFYNILKKDMAARNSTEFNALPLNKTALSDVVEQLRRTPVGLDSTLGRTVYYGVAYHHAGLTFDERDIVEGGFRQGILKVLIATSTLSSGVNLPARRVIIRSPVVHAGKMIDFLTYKQMIGRAGRKGVDTEGESILICKANEKSKAVTLVSSTLPPVHSCLLKDEGQQLSSSLKRAILEIVVSGVASCPKDVVTYISCTMLAASLPPDDQQATTIIHNCITFLQENEFVTLQKSTETDGWEEERFHPSQLGSAVLASSMSPDQGLLVFTELQKARQCFVLENELHIIYLVTPIYTLDLGDKIDWYQFYCMWEKLTPDMKRVAELVGVREGFLARAVQGRLPTKTVAQARAVAAHRRFYTTLILHDLVHEVPIIEVARHYNCNKGQLQSLQQSAATFAGMVTVFCARLGWHNLELILSQFQHRLTFGVQRELCDLVRLTLLNGQRARVLFNAGFHTVASLVSAAPADVEAVLKSSSPFQSNKKQENETEWEAEQRRKSRCIWLTGRKGVTEEEAALAIIAEAKSVIQEELGGLGIQWRDNQELESGERGAGSSDNDTEQGDGGTQPINKSVDNSSDTNTRVQIDSRNSQSNINISNHSDRSVIIGPGRGGRTTRPRTKYRRSINRSNISLTSKGNGSPIQHQSVKVSPQCRDQHKTMDLQVIVSPPGKAVIRSRSKPISIQGHLKDSAIEKVVTSRNSICALTNNQVGHISNGASQMKSVIGNSVYELRSTTPSVDSDDDENSIKHVTVSQSEPYDCGQRTISVSDDRFKPSMGGSVNIQHSMKTTSKTVISQKEQDSTKTLPNPVVVEVDIHAGTSVSSCTETLGSVGTGKQSTSPIKFDQIIDDMSFTFDDSFGLSGLTGKEVKGPEKADKAQMNDLDTINNEIVCTESPQLGDGDCDEGVDSIEVPSQVGGRSDSGEKNTKVKNSVTFYPGSSASNATTTTADSVSAHKHSRDIQNTQNEFADSFELDTQTDFMMRNVSETRGCKNESLTTRSVHKGDNSPPLYSEDLASGEMLEGRKPDRKSDRKMCNRDVEDSHSNNGRDRKEQMSETANAVNIGHVSRQKDSIQSSYIQNPVIVHKKVSVIDCIQGPLTDNSLHDVSMELIAASNFDDRRFGYAEEDAFELTGNEISNSSYGDLRIVPPNVVRNTSPVQRTRKGAPPQGQLTQDLVLALEMSDSFSCTAALAVEVEQSSKNCIGSGVNNSDSKPMGSGVNNSDSKPMGSGVNNSDSKPMGSGVNNSDSKPMGSGVNNSDLKPMGSGFNKSDSKPMGSGVNKSDSKPMGSGVNNSDLKPVRSGVNNSDSKPMGSGVNNSDSKPMGSRVNNSDLKPMGSGFNNSDLKPMGSGVSNIDSKPIGSGVSNSDPKCTGSGVRNNDLKTKRTVASNCVPKSNGVRIKDRKPESVQCESVDVVQICDRENEIDSMDESLTISMVEKALEINMVENTEKDMFNGYTQTVPNNTENNNPQLDTVVKPVAFLKTRCETAGVSSCTDKNTSVEQNKINKLSNAQPTHQKKSVSITSSHKHLSPGTLNFLNSMCESGSVSNGTNNRKPTGSVQSEKKSASITNNICLSSDAGLEDSVRITRSARKRRSTEKGEADKSKKQVTSGSGEKEDSIQNLSTNSDCLPPTPPPTNCMSPHMSLRKVTPLKPRTPRRGKASQKLDLCVGTRKPNSSKDSDLHPCDPPNVVYEERLPVIDPNDSGIPCTQASFTIVDVCADRRLFDTFIKEWATKSYYTLSVACENRPLTPVAGGGIGGNFGAPGSRDKGGVVDGLEVEGAELVVVGVAICWENRDAYYVALTKENSDCDLDDSLTPPPMDTSITIETRLSGLQSVLEQGVCGEELVNIAMFDVKASYCVLVRSCGIAPRGRFQDPKVACWLMDPGAKEKNLHRMVTNYLPTEVPLLEGIGGGVGFSSLGMTPQNPGSGRFRATTEAVLTLHLMDYLRACLHKEGLHQAFQRVEMPSIVTLARMQLNGFGFSEVECESQQSVMTAKLTALEEQAYQLAGHPFSLTSTEDVAQVLFIELQLPPNGDPSSVGQVQLPRKAPATRRGHQKPQFSTSKEVLEKLKKLHDLPGLVLEWRRISNALTKVVFPLQKEKVHVSHLNMHRIFSDCQVHTATGRVSMADPNLQNIPKDFEISLPDVIGESPPVNQTELRQTKVARGKGGNSRLRYFTGGPRQSVSAGNSGASWAVSMRHAFIPFTGGAILAADYSQLELRMIAHLSGDVKLTRILNRDGDVFKMIAAQWKSVSIEHVTPQQRQQAKQVCYGMVYGIGPKALGEQLEVDQNEAAVFIETFKSRYPGMRTFLRKSVETCREKGYVETILGRRRYLPSIRDTNPHARAHAERQAVNTTVQGSAADLVKKAMNRIDVRLSDVFPECSLAHRQKPTVRGTYGKNRANGVYKAPSGGYLVLQLHDELIYEVSCADVTEAAKIIKHEMEHAMTMSVLMPVKVKVGPSWGKLEDIEI
ncbi:DNA polymerase theta-like isoform X1 [Mizuhopecten yessoensis]|uniref:DNA polymerase theta-like isoform X1 n=1 Tax=Mizuhopecten yessoensis TaxID=6573 RepID=UPI000B45882E|nr:DNA polymerase theta-like isoform X1 [Mizuhopecten yessoensis]XP_021338876.1 DNA polymerase theta-like isoform X1 [Mizuhopecten yessoensis]